ncbi:hypothetical protein [Thermococcus aciditolerans]|uniref:hypothetical protein n=1 Tax=Thermococcus aciditolerans TaxID=2598455 RepID=UPI00143D7287|nr:hypothetical protein [Thermococcus aciditolerans]
MERRHLVCPLCGGTDFKVEEGKIDSKWGFTAHKVKIVICRNCGYVMMFHKLIRYFYI